MARKILTLEEVGQRTHLPIATIRYYRQTGQGPRLWKLGRRVVAYEDDVEAWLQETYEATVTKPVA